MWRIKLRIVVLKALFHPETVLLVEQFGRLVVLLDVQLHARDLFLLHTVLYGLFQ